MILRLIQAGGFTGKHKVAEEDLSEHSQALKDHVQEVFSGTGEQVKTPASPARDKERMFLEYEGKSLPVETLEPDSQLKSLIEKMKSNLKYKK